MSVVPNQKESKMIALFQIIIYISPSHFSACIVDNLKSLGGTEEQYIWAEMPLDQIPKGTKRIVNFTPNSQTDQQRKRTS